MKIVVGALTVSLAVGGVAFAQEPGGVVVEMAADAGTGTGARVSARKQATDYLAERGWTLGSNDDGKFIVILASSAIEGDPGSPKSATQRNIAYQKAMLDARMEMAETLSAEIQSAVARIDAEGRLPDDVAGTAAAGAIEKAMELARASGGNLQEVVRSEVFQRSIGVSAKSEVAGLQAFRVFEQIAPDGNGEIAVIATYSERGNEIRRALLGRAKAPTGAPGIRIGDWARGLGDEALLYSFGVQPKRDEKGEMVLVAFGQASPVSASSGAMRNARVRARAEAQEALRAFMGAMVESETDISQASSIQELADKSAKYASSEEFMNAVKAYAGLLDMPGVNAVHTWEHRHPFSDRDTAGVVMVWSVSQAVDAWGLRERFAADGASRGGAGITGNMPAAGQQAGQRPPQQPQRPRGGSGGAGAAGDEP